MRAALGSAYLYQSENMELPYCGLGFSLSLLCNTFGNIIASRTMRNVFMQ